MSLQSLVFCPDEKIVRVLRRVLSDLEIAVERCSDADSAIRKLTRQRFEAVIVDCSDEHTASLVLKSARSAPCNKHAVAVAIVDGNTKLRRDRKSTRLNSSHANISYAVFCLKKKSIQDMTRH